MFGLTRNEVNAVNAGFGYMELRALKSEEGLDKIEARSARIEEQLIEVVNEVAKFPEMVEIAVKKSYWKGFRDRGAIGILVGYAVSRIM